MEGQSDFQKDKEVVGVAQEFGRVVEGVVQEFGRVVEGAV